MFATQGGLGAVNARVYAVKANYNRLLDVARETYKENVGDIFALSNALSEEHNIKLTLVWQDGGFVFTVKKNELEDAGMDELPRGFVNVVGRKGKWVFSSVELVCFISLLLSPSLPRCDDSSGTLTFCRKNETHG